jgi:hypothetical protein
VLRGRVVASGAAELEASASAGCVGALASGPAFSTMIQVLSSASAGCWDAIALSREA